MKAINRIIELIGVSALFLLGVGITIEHSPNLIISIAIIIALAILSGVLLWISGLHEKRLEDELWAERDEKKSLINGIALQDGQIKIQDNLIIELNNDFANQVKATDEAEGRATHWKRKYEHYDLLYTTLCLKLNEKNIYPIVDGVDNIVIEIIKDDIPFNSDTEDVPFADPTYATAIVEHVCLECGEVMTRESKSMIFCDNPSCHRKQWRKDKLGVV